LFGARAVNGNELLEIGESITRASAVTAGCGSRPTGRTSTRSTRPPCHRSTRRCGAGSSPRSERWAWPMAPSGQSS